MTAQAIKNKTCIRCKSSYTVEREADYCLNCYMDYEDARKQVESLQASGSISELINAKEHLYMICREMGNIHV
jgi:hypothetical protein